MTSASQAVTTAQTTVNQNSQAVTSAQTAASNADQAVQSAQNKVNADQVQVDNLSKGTPADTTTQQNAVNTAKTALDNANGQVTTATNNVTTAQNAKTTADQNVTTAKIALDNAKSEEANKRAALSKAEETVTSAQNTLTNAQDAQKNQNSVINLPDSWYQEVKAKGDDAEVDKNYEDEGNKLLNSWVNNPADEKIKYTIGPGIKLPENLIIQLTRYFASLINPIRERLGHKPLIVNRRAVDYAIDCSYVFEGGDNDDE